MSSSAFHYTIAAGDSHHTQGVPGRTLTLLSWIIFFPGQLRWDRNRVIHYSGGDLVAVSSNRKIQLLDVIQVKELPIECRGHAGSVRALFLCEEENFLLSGSYDLSIRWVVKGSWGPPPQGLKSARGRNMHAFSFSCLLKTYPTDFLNNPYHFFFFIWRGKNQ